jgi:DNA topoisomerase-1
VKSQLDIMDPNFTAQMEEELDEVGAGKMKRTQLLKRFYKKFREQIEMSKKLASWKPKSETTDIACEECGAGVMIKKWGKNGWFLSCERYPKCKATRDLAAGGGAAAAVRETDFKCDKCTKPMVIKTGRFGDFLSCTGYPACKNARPVPLGVACPNCGGDIIEIRPRKKGGRTFYGCSNYNAEQKCDFKLWQRPIPEPCPNCGAAFLTRAGGKKPMLVCATKDCGYKRELPETDENGEPLSAPDEGGAEEGVEAAGAEPAPKAPPKSPPKPKESAPKPAAAAAAAAAAKGTAAKASKPAAAATPSEAAGPNGSKGAAKPATKARAEGPKSQAG